MGPGFARGARARYASGVRAKLFVVVLGTATGVFACTGGEALFTGLDLPGGPPRTNYEVPKSNLEASGSTFEKPGSTFEKPGRAITVEDVGCPPCGTYLCVAESSSSGTADGGARNGKATLPMAFTRSADGSCAFTRDDFSVILTCDGRVVSDGEAAGTWIASGSTVTARSAKGEITVCTVSDPIAQPAPTATTPPAPAPAPPRVDPAPTLDAGI